MINLAIDVAHLLGGAALLCSFLALYQRRLFAMLGVFALQALIIAAAASWQADTRDAPHLYISAGIAVVVKAIIIPVVLHRIVVRLGIQRPVETALGIGPTMAAGVGLVALSILLMLPVAVGSAMAARVTLALALSIVLLGLLTMITRRNAVAQVVGFMSLENGLILAVVGVEGMPLVVEMGIAFSVMVAFAVFGIVIFHIRERFDTLDIAYLESFRGERR